MLAIISFSQKGARSILRDTTCLVIISIIMGHNLIAQSTQIGIKVAYGRSEQREEGEIPIVLPFQAWTDNYCKVGLEYVWPLHQWLDVNSGIQFYSRFDEGASFNYLNVPASLDFIFGKKIHFIIGPGIDFSYLIAYNIKYEYAYTEFEESKNSFQIGCQGHLGVSLAMASESSIRLMYEHHFDITKMYVDGQSSPGGAHYTRDMHGFDGYLSLTYLTTSHFFQRKGND